MTSGGESEQLFEAYSIPSPARPLFQTAVGDLNRLLDVGGRWSARAPRGVGGGCIPPIRGRASELTVVGARIAAVVQGRGGGLVIEGPPGIGKSRLLTEVLVLAENAGVRALFGEAFEYQQTVPFFSLFMATLRRIPRSAMRRLCVAWARRPISATGWCTICKPPYMRPRPKHPWRSSSRTSTGPITPPCWRCGRWPRRGPMPRCCGCLPREPAPADRPFARR